MKYFLDDAEILEGKLYLDIENGGATGVLERPGEKPKKVWILSTYREIKELYTWIQIDCYSKKPGR